MSSAELLSCPEESHNCPAKTKFLMLHLNIFGIVCVTIHMLLQFEFWLGHKIKLGPEHDRQSLEAVTSP